MRFVHAGVVQAEGDPRGDHVLRERADKDQQVSSYFVNAYLFVHRYTAYFLLLDMFAHAFGRCLEEGAEDFLLKPVRPSDVSRLCSRVLR
jgi:hypothetical protein